MGFCHVVWCWHSPIWRLLHYAYSTSHHPSHPCAHDASNQTPLYHRPFCLTSLITFRDAHTNSHPQPTFAVHAQACFPVTSLCSLGSYGSYVGENGISPCGHSLIFVFYASHHVCFPSPYRVFYSHFSQDSVLVMIATPC